MHSFCLFDIVETFVQAGLAGIELIVRTSFTLALIFSKLMGKIFMALLATAYGIKISIIGIGIKYFGIACLFLFGMVRRCVIINIGIDLSGMFGTVTGFSGVISLVVGRMLIY